MRNKYLTLLSCMFFLTGYGQKNTVSSGADASGTGGTFSYSIGQIDYSNSISANEYVSEGVQQPYELYTIANVTEENSIISAIYPNPVDDYLTLEVKGVLQNSTVHVIDSKGKQTFVTSLTGIKTNLNLIDHNSGIYHLIIRQNNIDLESLKIIKN